MGGTHTHTDVQIETVLRNYVGTSFKNYNHTIIYNDKHFVGLVMVNCPSTCIIKCITQIFISYTIIIII